MPDWDGAAAWAARWGAVVRPMYGPVFRPELAGKGPLTAPEGWEEGWDL